MVDKGIQSAAQHVMRSKAAGTHIGFKALANKTSPALAAWIGRKKYGASGMEALSKAGR